jgi:sugar phosphate isomerase/epimerase
MQISFQLYSSRGVASQKQFLVQLAEMGYTQVEGYAGVYDNPADFKQAMQANGLTMPSGHFALSDLRHDLQASLQLADDLGISHVIAPYLSPEERPSDASSWKALADELADIASRVTAQG